jgi:hypothetical protein
MLQSGNWPTAEIGYEGSGYFVKDYVYLDNLAA